jgi:hypothetical protein
MSAALQVAGPASGVHIYGETFQCKLFNVLNHHYQQPSMRQRDLIKAQSHWQTLA